jgi:hypothetical protein
MNIAYQLIHIIMNWHLLLVGAIDGTLTLFSNAPGLPFSYQKKYSGL